jgi:hypothetical protein
MKHAWQAEHVISMQMADQNPHLTVYPSSRLQKLTLRTFPTIKKQEFWAAAYQDTGKVPKLVRDTSPCSQKGY